MKKPPKNILLIDKPKGISSYDAIRRLKREYPKQKIGHAGTLDPLASGLLLVGIGAGTKELHGLVGLSKEYVVEVLLGVKTDTGDMEGRVVESQKVTKVERKDIEKILNGLVGGIVLPVPAYSAIKQGGEALYKKARRGEKVDVPEKKMEIFEAELLDAFSYEEGYVLKIRMSVSSGTYVRSIAEEIGRRLAPTPFALLFLQNKNNGMSLTRNILNFIYAIYKGDVSITRKVWGLGVPATVKELRRTKVGEFCVEDAEELPS